MGLSKRTAYLILAFYLFFCWGIGRTSGRAIGEFVCAHGYFDSQAGECACDDGIVGAHCGICDNDDACGENARCDYNVSVVEGQKQKFYQCNMTGAALGLLSKGRVAIDCDIGSQNNVSCGMEIYEPGVRHIIDCSLRNCATAYGKVGIKCGNVTCEASKTAASKEVQILVGGIKGEALFTCGDGENLSDCEINLKEFFLQRLTARCSSSNCVALKSSGDAVDEETPILTEEESTYIKDQVIIAAGVVGMLLGLALIAVTVPALQKWDVDGAKLSASYANLHEKDALKDGLPGHILSFKNLCVELDSQSGSVCASGGSSTRTILDSLSGTARSGQIVGLMGPSGAGKTTLLNVLAGVSVRNLHTEGQVLLDGNARDSSYRHLAAFVQQEDDLMSTLTVSECILYSALLRLPSSVSRTQRRVMVRSIIDELSLQSVADSHIGDAKGVRGISGGEKKRVAIGMELVIRPRILFLDEPLSGLDSFNAFNLVQILHNLSRNGRVVVMSVHQPSAKAFMMLDKIMLLAKGQMVYQGPTKNVASYCKKLGYPCPEGENIADHILEMVSQDESLESILAGSDALANGCMEEQSSIASEEHELEIAEPIADEEVGKHGLRHFLRELNHLTKRAALNVLRHPALLRLHVVVCVSLGLIGGFIFHDLEDDLAGFQNRMGAFYFVLTFFAFASLSSLDLFIAERSIFLREHGARYYSTLGYYLPKAVLDALALRVLPVILFSPIFYFVMGLRPGGVYFVTFMLALILFNLVCGALCMSISIAAPTVGIGNLVSVIVLLTYLLFGGFLLSKETIPPAVSWIQYISPFMYAFEILLTNELQGQEILFNPVGVPAVPTKGETYLLTIGMNYEDQPRDVAILGVMALFYFLLAYFLLYYKANHEGSKWKARFSKFTKRGKANVSVKDQV